MERRLLKAIMTPAMIASWILGLILVVQGHWWTAGWFHGKLLLVLVLSAMHGVMAKWQKDFAADRNTRSATFYRAMNEVPTVLMIGIVILVIVKPF
jgi:putative membrane protein